MNITTILNAYKRPDVIKKQLESIENQSIKSKDILIWQNSGSYFEPSVLSKYTYAKCNNNLGVWARFALALNAKTEYVCIFDDDTIPGKLWYENCLFSNKLEEGLYGTIGLKFESISGYWPHRVFGWRHPNEDIEQVDIVGHSWFFKRDWLSYFWAELPDISQNMIVGEDIHFSYALQKYGNINTYVPPHPKNNTELWGSIPTYGYKYGGGKEAISSNKNNLDEMNYTLQKYISKGFKIINE